MNILIENQSEILQITTGNGKTPANISNVSHTETEIIFSVMQCFKHQATLL